MQHTRSRRIRGFLAATAVAALTAPVSQAALTVDARHQALLDKAPRVQVQVDPQHQILLMHRHAGQLNSVSSSPVTARDVTGWADAGIGAAALVGVALVGAGGLVVRRRKLATA